MIQRRAGETAPTDQDIAAAFKKIQEIIPADQVATITQARNSIGGLLGFCLTIFEAWQKLDLVISMDSHQKEFLTSIATLQEAEENLVKSLEIAETNHDVAMAELLSDLETRKTVFKSEKAILDAEIQNLEEEKVSLGNTLIESKKTFDTYNVMELQAKNSELARLENEIITAEAKLAKTQKAMDTLKAKLE
jgi:chromosome segregation ATPase